MPTTTVAPKTSDVVDVAEYLLSLSGPLESVQMHALLYLSQANHLAMTGRRLFDAEIQAWAQGPVVASLHELHARQEIIQPGSLHLARRRHLHALAHRERLRALRARFPAVLSLRTVRRAQRTADRAARLIA